MVKLLQKHHYEKKYFNSVGVAIAPSPPYGSATDANHPCYDTVSLNSNYNHKVDLFYYSTASSRGVHTP